MNFRPRFLINKMQLFGRNTGFTLIITFSRDIWVQNFFAYFNRMKIDMAHCHLLIIDNTDIGPLGEHLKERAKKYVGAFKSVRLYKTFRRVGGDPIIDGDTGFKRSKLPMILAMHFDMMRLCTTDKFVLLEDDTLSPPNAVMKLLRLLEQYPSCGIAIAIETGRSDVAYAKVRLGVHYITREGDKILERVSPNPKLRGLHSVDACGWYCCASYKNVWLRGFEGMEKYLDDVPRFALDGFHTNNIKLAGWDIIADFSLQCLHMQSAPPKILFWGKRQAVPQLDIWLPGFQEYAQGVPLAKPWHKKMLRNLTRRHDRHLKRS